MNYHEPPEVYVAVCEYCKKLDLQEKMVLVGDAPMCTDCQESLRIFAERLSKAEQTINRCLSSLK